MKHKILSTLILLTSIVGAQDLDIRRHIEVDATAKLLADADFATWEIKIRGEADSLAEASKRLDESSVRLKTSLSDAGFTGEIIRLSAISSGRHYEGDRDDRIFKGFFAERKAVVELRDLSKRQSVERVLLKDDRIEVSEINAQSSKHDDLRKLALIDAAKIAKTKASELANALGAEIGAVLSIRQGKAQYSWGYNMSNTIGAADDGAGSTELEKLSYSSTVTVKFELK